MSRSDGGASPSPRMYEELLNGMDVALCTLDRNWRFIFINDKAAELLDRPRAEIIGNSVREFYPKIEGFEMESRCRAALEQRIPSRFEYFCPTLSRWFDMGIYPVGDGFAIRAEDITDRKGSEIRLSESEERLTLIAEAAGLGIWDLDMVNDVATRSLRHDQIWGYSEMQAEWGFEIAMRNVVPEDKPAIMEAYERGIKSGTLSHENRVIRPDGSIRWIHAFGRFIYDSGGKPVRVLGIVEDITERKQAEERLRNSERELRGITDNSPDVIARFDRQLRHTFINPYGEKVYGRNREEIIGKSNAELGMPADKVEFWRFHFDEVLSTGRPVTVEFGFDSLTFGHQDFISTFVPEFDGNGTVQTILAITRDITDMKKAERELRESEERLRLALDAARMAAWDYDPATLKVTLSENAEEILELPKRHENSDQGYLLIHPDDVDRHRALVTRAIETGGSYVSVYRHAHGERELWLEEHGKAIVDRTGKTVRLAGVVQNITERKRMESAILESEERFRAVADNIAQLAWITDAEGKARWYNRRWYEYTGTDVETMRSRGWEKVHHPEHKAKVLERFQHSVETGVPWEDTFPLRGKDGGYRWFLSRAVPIRNDEGKIVRWFGTNTDITDLLETQERLEKTNEELEQFAYVASHDLQEPLRMVASYTELLEQFYGENLDETGRRYMNYVIDGAKRMQQLIQDLLSFSRVGRMNTEKTRIDANSILEIVIAGYREKIEQTGATVTYDGLPEVTANQTSLIQLFQNLVGNALKFRKPDEPPRVHVSAQKRGSMWLFSVKDWGIGIEPEYHEKIFVVFQRLHGKSEYPGTGIGLAICKKIVESYGGKIWVESEPGRGATFRFTLPATGGTLN